MDKKPLVITLLLAAGCKGNVQQETAPEKPESEPAPAPEPTAQQLPAEQPQPKPDDVLAEVDGVKLTRADAETEARVKLGDRYKNLPPQVQGIMIQRMLNNIVEQFIARRLLLKEAARLGIEVTEEDEKEAFEQIEANLPPGKTVEGIMQEIPMGEERMREEVLTGIRINKLLGVVMTNEVVISAEEVASFVEENKERLQRPERVRARHILFAVDAEDDEAARELKKQEADKVRQQLVGGGDFAEAAKEHSGCPSAARGGDLGEVARGRMVPLFEEAAFGQATNEIGPVIETRFGYHIVQVLERLEPDQIPDDDVRNMLRNRKYQENVKAYVETLKTGAEIRVAE